MDKLFCECCGNEFDLIYKVDENDAPVRKNYHGMIYYVSECCHTTKITQNGMRVGQGTLKEIWIGQYEPE